MAKTEVVGKEEFIKRWAEKLNATQKDMAEAFEKLPELFTEILNEGKKIQFAGFLTVELKEKKARVGHNPQTGAKVKIPASKAPEIKFAKSYKATFNA